MKKLFEKLGIRHGDFGFNLLQDETLFSSVTLVNGTLSWPSITKDIRLPSGTAITLTFDLDPISLYKNSKVDPTAGTSHQVGTRIKCIRKRLNLTQDEVAEAIGSNKQYISRIENEKADLEFNTLRKIVELGFEKNLFISYYDKDDVIRSYSNSIFTNSFLDWIESNAARLELIEGINDALKAAFEKENIKTTDALARLSYTTLMDFLENRGRPLAFYHHPESWLIQAKYLQQKDWLNLVKLQRMLKGKDSDKEISKLEMIARKETRKELFEI
jgi:transcriptional regulator with XRE-family HTH domain